MLCFIIGAVLETGEDKSAMNIGNYTFYYDDDVPPVIYCKSGLSGNTSSLGGWFFNDQPIGNDPVNCPASTSFAAETPSSSNPGVLPLVQCSGFGGFQLHLQSEGLYTCRIMDIDFQLHVFQVGIYFRRGGKFPFRHTVSSIKLSRNHKEKINKLFFFYKFSHCQVHTYFTYYSTLFSYKKYSDFYCTYILCFY